VRGQARRRGSAAWHGGERSSQRGKGFQHSPSLHGLMFSHRKGRWIAHLQQ